MSVSFWAGFARSQRLIWNQNFTAMRKGLDCMHQTGRRMHFSPPHLHLSPSLFSAARTYYTHTSPTVCLAMKLHALHNDKPTFTTCWHRILSNSHEIMQNLTAYVVHWVWGHSSKHIWSICGPLPVDRDVHFYVPLYQDFSYQHRVTRPHWRNLLERITLHHIYMYMHYSSATNSGIILSCGSWDSGATSIWYRRKAPCLQHTNLSPFLGERERWRTFGILETRLFELLDSSSGRTSQI